MMKLTVKDNGVRVANPSYKGSRISGDQIKHYHSTLLEELGFKKEGRPFWMHSSTSKFEASSLCVVWKEDPYVLSIQRGDFVKNLRIGGEYDLHDFVSEVLQSVRDVWVEGGKQR
jgi:hypothetical protein